MGLDLPTLLTFAQEQGASDLHISAGESPRIRVKGQMQSLEMTPLTAEEAGDGIYAILEAEQREEFEKNLDLDFSFELPGVSRFRGNIFMQNRGPGAVFRIINSKILTLDDLGMPEVLKTLSAKEKGLVIVTGPTGSGKSTTLAAMVNHVNETRHGHILTVEDPIEFVHQSKTCLVNQREVGHHTETFATALRAALREDPDIILVGELRDLETTSLAITAAETGHLVFATLHTNSAAKTIDRLIDIFPAGEQSQVRTMLSESLEGIVAQTLLPTADGEGRVAAIEVLVGVPALRNMIREDKTAQILSIMQTGASYGMQSLDQALQDLVMQGKISRRDALQKSTNPKLFESGSGGGGLSGRPAAPSGGAQGPAARSAQPAARSAQPAARPTQPAANEKPKRGGLFSRG